MLTTEIIRNNQAMDQIVMTKTEENTFKLQRENDEFSNVYDDLMR